MFGLAFVFLYLGLLIFKHNKLQTFESYGKQRTIIYQTIWD